MSWVTRTSATLDFFQLMPDSRVMVLDTSVVLNLMGSGDAARIVHALGTKCLLPPQVMTEVTREPPYPGQSKTLRNLIADGVFHELVPTSEFLEAFVGLASALPPDGLGDGEAATIAGAEMLECAAVIDEKKGKRIALTRRPLMDVHSTAELYQSLDVSAAIPRNELAQLLFSSLQYARMRVPHLHGRWAVDLIGLDAARECPSLAAVVRTLRC